VPRSVPREAERDECVPFPEADELALGTRARREPLRAEVERLEQVRLADAVVADDEHEPRREAEVEGGVGAVVPERDVRDDQPASRIGMSRYV